MSLALALALLVFPGSIDVVMPMIWFVSYPLSESIFKMLKPFSASDVGWVYWIWTSIFMSPLSFLMFGMATGWVVDKIKKKKKHKKK